MDPEDRLVTTTPDGVDLEVVLAGFGSRLGAVLLDTLIQLVLLSGLALATSQVFTNSGETEDLLRDAAASAGVFLIAFGYFVVLETLNHGRTIGKSAAGLRVVRLDGRPLGFLASLLRTVLRIVDYLPLGLVGTVLILATRRHQRVGDLAAGTIVIRERRAADARAALPERWVRADDPVAYPALRWDVTGVSPEQLVLAERFLASRRDYRPEARERLAEQLRAALAGGVAGAPEGLSAEGFLEGVVAAKTGVAPAEVFEPWARPTRRRR